MMIFWSIIKKIQVNMFLLIMIISIYKILNTKKTGLPLVILIITLISVQIYYASMYVGFISKSINPSYDITLIIILLFIK